MKTYMLSFTEGTLSKNLDQTDPKLLDGITFHSRQELIGTACISGDTVEKLREHLVTNKLGAIFENVRRWGASPTEKA